MPPSSKKSSKSSTAAAPRGARPGQPKARRVAGRNTPFRAAAPRVAPRAEPVAAPAPAAGLPATAAQAGHSAESERAYKAHTRAAAAQPEAPTAKLQKLLADAGLGSRREIEAWIDEGRVSVNGEPAHVGQRISVHDKVKVNGRLVQLRQHADERPRVLIYHKPEGEIVSRQDPQGRATVFERLPRLRGARWIAVGRLDFNSCGLLLFTNSGELADKLMHPSSHIEREYAVRILGELKPEAKQMLLDGIELDDGLAQFGRLVEAGGEGSNRWYQVTLSEGRNREVRRMFAAVGLTVSRLMRVRYGPVLLPQRLKRGKTMELLPHEVDKLIKMITLTPPKGGARK